MCRITQVRYRVALQGCYGTLRFESGFHEKGQCIESEQKSQSEMPHVSDRFNAEDA